MSAHPNPSLPRLATYATALIAFAALLVVLSLVNGSAAPSGGSPASADAPPANTAQLVTDLQTAIEADPTDSHVYGLLGDAYYQRARETGDPAYYSRAERAYQTALEGDPGDPVATVGAGRWPLPATTSRPGSSSAAARTCSPPTWSGRTR